MGLMGAEVSVAHVRQVMSVWTVSVALPSAKARPAGQMDAGASVENARKVFTATKPRTVSLARVATRSAGQTSAGIRAAHVQRVITVTQQDTVSFAPARARSAGRTAVAIPVEHAPPARHASLAPGRALLRCLTNARFTIRQAVQAAGARLASVS